MSETVITHSAFTRAWPQARKFIEDPKALDTLELQLGNLAKKLVQKRTNRMRAQLGCLSIEDNSKRLYDILQRLKDGPDGMRNFLEFQQICAEELAGIVLTAHPTFSFHEETRSAITTGLTTGTIGDFKELKPHQSPSLQEERDQAEAAMMHLRMAHRRVMKIAFDVAQDLYPDDWTDFNPCILTLASWVGFDLDGRTDISWSTSLDFRYHLALQGLTLLDKQLDQFLGAAKPPAKEILTAIKDALSTLMDAFNAGRQMLEGEHSSDSPNFADLNKKAVHYKGIKEDAIRALSQQLDQLMALPLDASLLSDYGVFRSEWKTFGLGLCHIHFRLNAAQLHNAIRSKLELTGAPDRSASRRHFMAAITDLLDQVKPVSIHYGTLNKEKTTARRVFMLAAQFEKHFDGHTPIRMLVAESDTPFTMLTALYYARLFDVDDHVEISPLFETALGLQRGDRVIDELLDNPHFDAYIRKQGRFCVQLGFSDSGRYIGQLAANLAIERFKLRLTRLWKKRGLEDIQLLFFDTHGESMGRGAHPASLRDRFLYTHTPEVRRNLSGLMMPHKHEVSFQGGDGYLWFGSEETALSVLTDFLDCRFSSRQADHHDYLYAYSGWSLDFFLTLREFQEEMSDSKGYVAMIDSIGRNMLYPTGSRASKRQGPGSGGVALESVSQLRAIPHNATLQQLGYLANSIAGLSKAIALMPDRFSEVHAKSDRLQRLMKLGLTAMGYSSSQVLKGYEEVISSDSWLSLADQCDDDTLRERMMDISETLEPLFRREVMGKEIRKLRRDYNQLCAQVKELDLDSSAATRPSAEWEQIHSLRLSLVQFIYMKAMEIPKFSTRLDISLTDMLDDLFHLDVDASMDKLEAIFPVDLETSDGLVYGEDQTFEDQLQGYHRENEMIFKPIRRAYDSLLVLSALLAQEIGAFG